MTLNQPGQQSTSTAEENEEVVLNLLSGLSKDGNFRSLLRISEHLHRLRMSKEYYYIRSNREELVWLMICALEALAQNYDAEVGHCLDDFQSVLSKSDDGSVPQSRISDYDMRAKEMLSIIRTERYRAATLMGNTLGELLDPRSLLKNE